MIPKNSRFDGPLPITRSHRAGTNPARPVQQSWHTPERILRRRIEALLIGDSCETPAGYVRATITRTRQWGFAVCVPGCEPEEICVVRSLNKTIEKTIRHIENLPDIPVQLPLF